MFYQPKLSLYSSAFGFLAQTPLTPHPIMSSYYLNPSVPSSNRVPFTLKWAHPCFVSQNWAPHGLVFGLLAQTGSLLHLTQLHLITASIPAYSIPIGFPLYQNKPAHVLLAKIKPPQLRFWFFSLNQTSLTPHLIVLSYHLNSSIPYPNKVLFIPKWAHPCFVSPNQALWLGFCFFGPNQTLFMPYLIMPTYHLNPTQLGSPLFQSLPAHVLLAKTNSLQLGFLFSFWPCLVP